MLTREIAPGPALPLSHEQTLRLDDGRRLRRWALDDRRRQVYRGAVGSGTYLDFEGWDGPKTLIVLGTIDNTPNHGPLLHVSVSFQDHDPTWADLKLIRYAFFPRDVDVMCLLPSDDTYVSGIEPVRDRRGRVAVHGAPGGADSHVFHLTQTPTVWGYG